MDPNVMSHMENIAKPEHYTFMKNTVYKHLKYAHLFMPK